MTDSRLRAPYAVLRELLGEPLPDAGPDKSSTCFVHAFEDQDISVHDFHKEEWGEEPACLTDSRYVWRVSGDQDVSKFCRWLSAEVKRRMARAAGGTTLDAGGKAELNRLLAEGLSLDEALKQVKRHPAASHEDWLFEPASQGEEKRVPSREATRDYAWPPPDDPGFP